MNEMMSTQAKNIYVQGSEARLAGMDTRNLLDLGYEYGWDLNVLGSAPMPDSPVRLGDWLIVPAQLDSSPIPERAFQRVQEIFASGLRPQGFMVVHEAPMLLGDASARQPTLNSTSPVEWKSALKIAGGVVGGIGLTVATVSGLAILAVAAVSLAAILLVPAALIAGAVVLDPILIVVTQDNVWVEIDRWDI